MSEQLYQVKTHYFACGLVVDVLAQRVGILRVSDAAPIMKWAVGKPLLQVADWVRRKGGTIERVK